MDTDIAKAVLSGAYERRRGYLTAVAMAWNQIAIMGTLAIWAFLLRWDTLSRDETLFATQVAWAGALSSLLIGLWRYWARRLDGDIVRLYPVIYLAERRCLAAELCTISPPGGAQSLSPATIDAGINYRDVRTAEFGSRGHAALDLVPVSLIVLMAVISILVAVTSGIVTLSCVDLRVPVVWLLVANLLGLALIVVGYLSWRQRRLRWPVPKSSDAAAASPA